MAWLFLVFLAMLLLASLLHVRLLLFSLACLIVQVVFYRFHLLSDYSFYGLFVLSSLFFLVLNNKKLRRRFVTKFLYNQLLNSSNKWQSFQKIDDGWFASEFEQNIFQGRPDFIRVSAKNREQEVSKIEIERSIYRELMDDKKTNISKINHLAKVGATSLIIQQAFDGQNLCATEASLVLKNLSKLNPVVAAIIGIMNLDSLTSFIHHFGNHQQRKKLLPLFSSGKMLPFLKPTSLYETLDSQKSSIEGRVEQIFINGHQQTGIRVSFRDVILLGTSQSNCFYLNVNLKDFTNLLGGNTHLGTAICIIDKSIKSIKYKKGLKAYDDYLYYYSCTGKNIFIPFDNIINGKEGIGRGLEYLYKNQYFASSIWPLAISIPTNNTATLTAWYFAHLQKQNGRQLLSYKIVLSKLNEQFSQCLKLQVMEKLTLHNNLAPPVLKFTAILNKNAHITQTMKQLGLLRSILGSNSHNIKTESNVRSFYKVAHLSTELDGMSHEINQLPLIKKAALACHPYYSQEVKCLLEDTKDNRMVFDETIFKHLGYILHNLSKTWLYAFKASSVGRLLFPKYKYKTMIKRMSSSFAFLADVTLIVWTFKHKINTSFASQLAHCIQHITSSIALYDFYTTQSKDEHSKELAKITLKNTLFFSQNALKETLNLAFNRLPAFFTKVLIFPFGRPFYPIKVFKSLHNDIEEICQLEESKNSPYTKYSPFLKKIFTAKQKLKNAEAAEIAVTNATGTPLNTDNYEVLINRCLAAGIVSVEQSEQLRDAYISILEIKLTNHFGNQYEK